jgi:hypothetical protein
MSSYMDLNSHLAELTPPRLTVQHRHLAVDHLVARRLPIQVLMFFSQLILMLFDNMLFVHIYVIGF